jgi:hypothetical protein
MLGDNLVVDIDHVRSLGWSDEKIISDLIDLDYLTLDELTESDEGGLDQWVKVVRKSPRTLKMIINNNERIVGYLYFVPLNKEAFNKAKDGDLLDGEITVDDVEDFSIYGVNNIYIVQVCILKEFRTLEIMTNLMTEFFDELKLLELDGFFIQEVCANAYTKAGYLLCKKLGLSEYSGHKSRGTVFCGFVEDVLFSDLAVQIGYI